MRSRFLWLALAGLTPNIACATMLLEADTDFDSYSLSWSGGEMLPTGSLLRPWQPYYIIRVYFDPSFANVGTLRIETTDGYQDKPVEWDLSSELDDKSEIVFSDLHQGPLDGSFELTLLSGSAKITSIRIEKTIGEEVPDVGTRGRTYRLDVDPVPEPSVGVLLGGSLASLGLFRRRKRYRTPA